jgi:hypothetical protein
MTQNETNVSPLSTQRQIVAGGYDLRIPDVLGNLDIRARTVEREAACTTTATGLESRFDARLVAR